MQAYWNQALKIYFHPQMMRLALLGFASGLPLLLTGSTLAFWLYGEGYSKSTLGFLSFLALPYTLKFLWAPVVDRLALPYLTDLLGRRRSWLFFSQICLIGALFSISLLDPIHDFAVMCGVCFFISFASATQDIVMLAYQFETLYKYQYGAGESVSIFGYRMGMLVASSGALYLTPFLSWSAIYQVMAALVGLCLFVTLFSPEPVPVSRKEVHLQERNISLYLSRKGTFSRQMNRFLGVLYGAVVCPFHDFIKGRPWVLILTLMFFYKISDNLVGNLHGIFFREMGFSGPEIASASKFFGLWASILGGAIGGIVIVRSGIYSLLLYGCALHGLSIFSYLLFSPDDPQMWMIYTAVAVDHITGGIRLTALFAYQMSLCKPLYAATQLALFTSIVHFGRVSCGALSGVLVEKMGWDWFYVLMAVLSLPVLGLVFALRHKIRATTAYDGRVFDGFKKGS